ncbi:MAG TPA: hypothetical protein PL033_21395 [Candidatus Brocadiia bacterium]|nr:hypothetical protein [Candidatus Brocadiia bacterium]
MAITADRFMDLNGLSELRITGHALGRIEEQVGCEVGADDIADPFLTARQVKPFQMLILGYRPKYATRKSSGEKSWYFRFLFKAWEFIAVLSQKGDGQIKWVTTYARNPQNDALRLLDFDELMPAVQASDAAIRQIA